MSNNLMAETSSVRLGEASVKNASQLSQRPFDTAVWFVVVGLQYRCYSLGCSISLNGFSRVISMFASIYGAQNDVYGEIWCFKYRHSCHYRVAVICIFLTEIYYSLWKLEQTLLRVYLNV
jgi:hypothetical protein